MSRTLRRRRPAAEEDAATPAEARHEARHEARPGARSGAGTETIVEPPEEAVPGSGVAALAERRAERRRTLGHTTGVLLLRAAHPRLALLTAAGLAVAAALSGRSGREVLLVLGTALVGQAILGWHNDLVDRARDDAAGRSAKPVAGGLLDPGTAWFALICGVLLLVPLSISNGVTAGCLYLVYVAVGLVGNVMLRRGVLSWVTWAASYALLPGFLSYGGWGGATVGDPPQPALVALAALLGVGVHFLCALPGLVADHEAGDRHLPLRLALRIGATRLLVLSLLWTALVLVAMLVVGDSVGLRA